MFDTGGDPSRVKRRQAPFLVRSAGRTLCGVRGSAAGGSGGTEPRTLVVGAGGSMDVSKRDAGLADSHMDVGRAGCGGCSLRLEGHNFVTRASPCYSVGRGSDSGIDAGDSDCRRGSLYVVRIARWARVWHGAAGSWGSGPPHWSGALAPG